MYKIWNKLFGFDYVKIYTSLGFRIVRIKKKRNTGKVYVTMAHMRGVKGRIEFPVISAGRINEWLTCEASKYLPNKLPTIPYGSK